MLFQIHRLKDSLAANYRWAPHTAGLTHVKPKDYEPGGQVEAASCYAAWSGMAGTDQPLRVGDLIESPNGDLRICKYVGFEQAQWVQPEAATVEPVPTPSSQGN